MKYHEKEMETEHPSGCVAMTWEDAMEMEKANKDNGWGFSTPDLLHMIADHMNAHYDTEDGKTPLEACRCAEKIEWRLEDANFHTLCGLLNCADYKKAIEYVANDLV